ncbi:hypothetical protein H4R34_003514 [Dimargaris verticillata]|uniref:SWR1-complex protein 5 n=1 Tax=Dimargaris verticillata TaxID=2761393 RepID=A0A9W8EBY6_9FUNG|nr:hypothetical protein H4R34_003514 [Dimargaris verticillata]
MAPHAASSSKSDNDSDFVPDCAESPIDPDTLPSPKKRSPALCDSKSRDSDQHANAKRQRIEELWQSIKQPNDTSRTPPQAATTTQQQPTPVAAKNLPSTTKNPMSNSASLRTPTARPLTRPVRRASKMSQLASTLQSLKPSRSNTLEQSRSKWDTFVRSEDLKEDLIHHNKDGYLERQAFIARTEARADAEYLRSRKER